MPSARSRQPERVIKRIERIKRLNLSVNGNPRFNIVFSDDTEANTASDHAFAYAVGNPEMRVGSTVVVEYTRAGLIAHMAPYQP